MPGKSIGKACNDAGSKKGLEAAWSTTMVSDDKCFGELQSLNPYVDVKFTNPYVDITVLKELLGC